MFARLITMFTIVITVQAQGAAPSEEQVGKNVAPQMATPVTWNVEFIGFPRAWMHKSVISRSEYEVYQSVTVVLRPPVGKSVPPTPEVRDAAITRVRYIVGKDLFGDKAAKMLTFYEMPDSKIIQFHAAYIVGDQWIGLKGCVDGSQVTGIRVFYAREKQSDAHKKAFPKLPKGVECEKRKIGAFSGDRKDVTLENTKQLDGVILSWGTICFAKPPTTKTVPKATEPAEQ